MCRLHNPHRWEKGGAEENEFMDDLPPRLEVAETAVSSPKHSRVEILPIENVCSQMGSLLLDFKGVNINLACTSAKHSGVRSRRSAKGARILHVV